MFRDRVLRPVIQNLISSPSSPSSSSSSKTVARKNVPTILPPNVDLNVFRELPLSIQEEHINQYRESYRMEARKEAIEYCQNRVLTPRELMRPVTCSQRKNQEIERLHNEYKSAKRAYYRDGEDEETKETLKERAIEAKKKWKRLSGSSLQLSPAHRNRKEPVLCDGDEEERNNDELGSVVSMVLLTDMFRTITHPSILLDIVSRLLNSKSWPRLQQTLHSADDRLILCFLCLIDAILDSGYGTNMMYAFNETDETGISSMPLYKDVCKKMKMNFGIQVNEKKKSVLLNSMIELLLMSPPRPLLTMLSTSVLILRMLRSKTDRKKLYAVLL